MNYADSFGRFDQYMYPYYKKSVEENKEMTREQALELLECFFVKTAEWTQLYDYNSASVQVAFSDYTKSIDRRTDKRGNGCMQ